MKVAIFDFDGTLLRGNSWQLFFWWRLRQRPWRAPVWLGALGLRRLGLVSGGWLRNQVLVAWRGCPVDELDALGREFFQQVLQPRLRPEALRELAACREAGCEIVLLTGAFDFTVKPFVEQMGIRHWQATRLAREGDRCAGRRQGPELVGEHKVAALRDLLGDRAVDWARSRAYGDEPDDLPVLRQVGQPCYVRSRRPLPPLPAGCQIVDWGT